MDINVRSLRLKRTQTCEGCSLHGKSRSGYTQPLRIDPSEVVGDGYEPVEVLVVGDPPFGDDAAFDEYMHDSMGRRIITALKALNTSVLVIPAVRCHPRGDVDHFILKKKYKGGFTFQRKTPLDYAYEAVAQCQDYLAMVLPKVRPRIVVAMGPLATEALGLGRGVHSLRVKPLQRLGIKTISQEGTMVTFDRGYATVSAHAQRDLYADFEERLPNLLRIGHATPKGRRDTIRHTVLTTVGQVEGFVDAALGTADLLSFDYETAGLPFSPKVNRILNAGFSFRKKEDEAVVIPVAHPETPFLANDLPEVYKALRKLLDPPKGVKLHGYIAHNAQFEAGITKAFLDVWLGETADLAILDTMVLAYLEDENRHGIGIEKPYALETLASNYLDFRWYETTQIKGRRDRLIEERLDLVNEYVGVDAAVTSRLFNFLTQRMRAEGSYKDLMNLALRLYSPAIRYTTDLTLTGQAVDVELLRMLRMPNSSIKRRLHEIDAAFDAAPEVARAMASSAQGETEAKAKPLFNTNKRTGFSINSPLHRKALFWGVMKLEGADESQDKGFQKLHESEPLVALYTEHNKLSKLDTAYLAPIADFLQQSPFGDMRVRPSFNLINTTSGRLSANNPNSQQTPRGDTRDKRQIKALFRAALGRVLVQLDFSQAEVRWLGILSGDENLARKYAIAEELKEALLRDPTNKDLQRRLVVDGDLHMSTALDMYQLPRDLPFTDKDKAKLARQDIKTITFGLIYGKIAFSLAKDLKIEEEEAARKINLWMGQFPHAAQWLLDVDDSIGRTGIAHSPFGRWRRLPEAMASNVSVRNRAKRQARNTPIQSAASDFCIYAACKLRDALRADPLLRDVRLINTVHDSLIAEMPNDPEVVEAYCRVAKRIFTDRSLIQEDFGVQIHVPLAVDFEIGPNWGNLQGYDLTPPSLERCLHNAQVLAGMPSGTLYSDLAGKGLLLDAKND